MRFSGSTGNFAGEFLLLKRPKSLEIRNAAPNPMLPLLGCELALLPSITNPGIRLGLNEFLLKFFSRVASE